MEKRMKKIITVVVFLISIVAFTGCSKLDVIRDHSVESFDKILELSQDRISKIEEMGAWSLEAPDQTSRFVWSYDYGKSDIDVYLETDAKPFLEAGLDSNKLPEGMLVGEKIIIGNALGDQSGEGENSTSASGAYKQLVNHSRGLLGYHGTLDHFGIELGHGNMFEWAKNTQTNDKDIVFVLNPKVFIEAGVDPEQVEGWIFAEVEGMDAKGKKVHMDKLLKPFDIDGRP